MSKESKKATAVKASKKLPVIAVFIIALFLVNGVAGFLFLPHDPLAMSLTNKLTPPFFMEGGSFRYLLGTDELGRDILSRIMLGGKISLIVALAAIVVGGLLGTALGIIAGYYGGIHNTLIMRLTDASLAFPSILLALLLAISMGAGVKSAIISISFSMWAKYTRTIKTEVITLKKKNFVEQAKIMGASDLRIIARHIIPNITSVVIVMVTLEIGMAIILEASLSFLGLSVSPPTPSWGQMIADGNNYFLKAWWISVFPALVTILTVLSFQRLGEWLKGKGGTVR
jgi:peptide/nickel transport system permease protein